NESPEREISAGVRRKLEPITAASLTWYLSWEARREPFFVRRHDPSGRIGVFGKTQVHPLTLCPAHKPRRSHLRNRSIFGRIGRIFHRLIESDKPIAACFKPAQQFSETIGIQIVGVD